MRRDGARRGTRGTHEINFAGCVENENTVIGRGRLICERATIRLERINTTIRALCTANGKQWFSVGEVEFSTEDPVEVGLHAIGNIDRLIYPGAYTDGTAMKFESFEMWRK